MRTTHLGHWLLAGIVFLCLGQVAVEEVQSAFGQGAGGIGAGLSVIDGDALPSAQQASERSSSAAQPASQIPAGQSETRPSSSTKTSRASDLEMPFFSFGSLTLGE